MDEDLIKINLKIPKNYFGQAVFNLQLAGITLHVAEIIHICKSLHAEDLLFTISYIMAHLIGCAKITVLLIKRRLVSNFLKSIEEGRFLPNIERGGLQELNLIQQAIAKTTFQIRTWWAIVFVMLSNRMIWIALNPTLDYVSPQNPNVTITMRQLPYTTSYLISFDMQKSPFYELIFIHQCISTWIFGWYMGNADNITNGLIIHLTAQFKIVANSFAVIAEKAEKLTNKHKNKNQTLTTKTVKVLSKNDIGNAEVDAIEKYERKFLENFKKCLRDCIQHHQDTLNLAENMEETFNMMLLMQFVGCLVIYSIQLYQLSLLPVTSTAFISMSFFFFAMVLQLLVFCWNGNELTIASEAIADAVYNTEWMTSDNTAKTLISQIIMRAQKPVYITAGKFSTLSMATFATILRGSVSYFSVLLKVNDEKVD